MMSKPLVNEVNVSTGESITREMTDEEYVQYLKDIENISTEVTE